MWRRVRFVWFGLWVVAAGLLVAASVLTVQSRGEDDRRARAEADALDRVATRQLQEPLLLADQERLTSTLAQFDAARATYRSRAGERDEARSRVDARLADVDALRNGVTAEGLKILDQGTHLQELVLCLKAGERTLHALAGGDTTTALASLQSADAECRSSAEFLAERTNGATPVAADPNTEGAVP